MEPEEIETRLMDLQALTCQALADPKRLRILYALAGKELSVGELAEILETSLSNASQHLGVLRARGLVRPRRAGAMMLYSLAHPEILEACRTLRGVLLKQLAEDSRMSSLLESKP